MRIIRIKRSRLQMLVCVVGLLCLMTVVVLRHSRNNSGSNLRKTRETNDLNIDLETTMDPDLRRLYVREMIKDAWTTFVAVDINADEIRPISRSSHSSSLFGESGHMGVTVIDSLDTLLLADLFPEYEMGLQWVTRRFQPKKLVGQISVFETNIRILGGLLSAYTLRGGNDEVLLDRAVEVADLLLLAYNKQSKLFMSSIDFSSGIADGLRWAGNCVILSECGTLTLEFEYLSKLTGDPKYKNAVREQYDRLYHRHRSSSTGIYNDYVPLEDEKTSCIRHVSFGALGDSFYEYLLKIYLLNERKNHTQLEIYADAVGSIEKELLRTFNDSAYFGVKDYDRFRNSMEHLACFSGGLYFLAHNTSSYNKIARETLDHWYETGTKLTKMCRKAYESGSSHLGPEIFSVSPKGEPGPLIGAKHYLLRPEYVESLFYASRITGDQKYRDWAWDVVKALQTNCHVTTGGYSGIKDVYKTNPEKDDVQQSFFIAETLKYLYLIFCESDVMPLDRFVFNTEAHPFAIGQLNK